MRIFRLLYVQVLVGIVLGVLAGLFFPRFAPVAKGISEVFINAIRMVIAPVIFFTVVAGIAGAGNLKQAGRVGLKAFIYFEIVSTIALLLGLLMGNLVQPGRGAAHGTGKSGQVQELTQKAAAMDWGSFFTHLVPANIVDAFAKGEILQVLLFSILFAVGLRSVGARGAALLQTFDTINGALFRILHIVMRASPLGAFGGMAFTVGKFGAGSLAAMGRLMATFYGTGLIFLFVVLALLCRWQGFSFLKLLRYIRAELAIVLGASSSEPVLPSLMEKMRRAGVEEEVVGLVVPTGYSFNLDGTAIYLSMATLFIAQAYNVPLGWAEQLTIVGVLLLTSKGAAGVTGSGLLVLASTLGALKIIPVEGLALLVGVDRFMSEGRALVNFIGNAAATVIVGLSEKAVDRDRLQAALDGRISDEP
ncbi:MAG: C4-dicarboxylate transporter DctA [Chitinophagaceae bacterium]|nr:MAG: C4-dicarboxylate transporter DctA [Chitinophagaceae bacterium]